VTVVEMRHKEVNDLRREVAAHEKEIWKLRFSRGSEKAGDPNRIRKLRKEVARMMTVLRERELGIERGAAK
jgi:large subunit ribosomal protein L29